MSFCRALKTQACLGLPWLDFLLGIMLPLLLICFALPSLPSPVSQLFSDGISFPLNLLTSAVPNLALTGALTPAMNSILESGD